jgi:predicted alpha/beta hydrolase family esterase
MDASFLILHGIENHRPPQHWQFLLAARLVEAGHDVRYPALPDPDAPTLDAWLAALDDELAPLGGRRVVVCHSLACLLWLHAAARGLADPVDRVLLVAPPAPESVPEGGASFRDVTLDGPAVRAAARGETLLVCSDGDPYCPPGAQATYGDPLGLMAIVLPGAGHITPDTGFGPWPFVLDWCLGRGGPPTA